MVNRDIFFFRGRKEKKTCSLFFHSMNMCIRTKKIPENRSHTWTLTKLYCKYEILHKTIGVRFIQESYNKNSKCNSYFFLIHSLLFLFCMNDLSKFDK